MKIAITCPASLPATQFGGILFVAVDIAKNTSKTENEVVIYTTDLDFSNNVDSFNKKLPRIEKIDGFTIKRSHVFFRIELFFVNFGMYKQIINDKPDIIHAIGIRSFQAFLAAIISKFHNIPLIISDQGGLFTHPDFQKKGRKRLLYRLQEPMIRFIIRRAKKIIVANEYEHSIFLKYCDSSKLTLVRNGIDFENLQNCPFDFKMKHKIQEKLILFLGRFAEVKGIDLLLKAFSNISQNVNFKKVHLVIMGANFGFSEKMYNLIQKLNLNDRVSVIEKPTRDEVISAYHACEFLVLPSRWEMSPLTPLEGFACKKPTISTRIHGIPYVVEDEKDGLLFEKENIEELTEKISILLTDEEKRRRLGEKGFIKAKNSNSKEMASKILNVYECVLKHNKKNNVRNSEK